MAKKGKDPEHYDKLRARSGWYLAAWRDFRGLSQQELAEELATSKGRLSDIETGATNSRGVTARYNRDYLEGASKALNVAAGDLIDTNPYKSEPRFAALERAFPELDDKDRETLADMAESLKRRKR